MSNKLVKETKKKGVRKNNFILPVLAAIVVVCQNCLNQFMLTDVGEAHGGCNPIPINFKEQDGFVVIATSDLDGNASKFINWKQGI